MSSRAETLASKVEQANNDLLKAIEGSSDDQWRATCADGVWTQGFAGFHAASSISFISGMVQGIASGEPFTPTTLEVIDEGNAAQAKEHAGCTKQETIALIRAAGPASAAMVRGLSDEALDRRAQLLVGMPEMTVEQVIEMLMVGHAAGHTQSIVNAR
ncbi:MAG TPA: DinB family protein [Dehalococcoidia bacterium]|nr:DinB family protein [Dehalococcoidia bacterium]